MTKPSTDDIAAYAAKLEDALVAFLGDEPEPDNHSNLITMYTQSPKYLTDIIAQFHTQPDVLRFMAWLVDEIKPGQTVWDVGCSCGFTGLTLARYGHNVAFHDFEGMGLEFIRHFATSEGLAVEVLPYVFPVPRRDWAVALDVIEHTGNHLGFLRWMKDLGDTVAFSIPNPPFLPPFVPVVDEWVDKEAIIWTIERRYDVLRNDVDDGRYYLVYK